MRSSHHGGLRLRWLESIVAVLLVLGTSTSAMSLWLPSTAATVGCGSSNGGGTFTQNGNTSSSSPRRRRTATMTTMLLLLGGGWTKKIDRTTTKHATAGAYFPNYDEGHCCVCAWLGSRRRLTRENLNVTRSRYPRDSMNATKILFSFFPLHDPAVVFIFFVRSCVGDLLSWYLYIANRIIFMSYSPLYCTVIGTITAGRIL